MTDGSEKPMSNRVNGSKRGQKVKQIGLFFNFDISSH